MVDFVACVLVVAAFAAIVHRFTPGPGERAAVLLERYRLHAPMVGWSISFRDEQRQYAELAAIAARRDAEARAGRSSAAVGADAPAASGVGSASSVIRPARAARYRLGRLRRAVQF